MREESLRQPHTPWSGSLARFCSLASLLALLLGSSVAHQTQPSYAAGEVLSVNPAVASQGDFLTIEVSQIRSSSFCDYLPYAGDGYFSQVYIVGFGNGAPFHMFPQRSVTFDPRQQESITMEVGPIPAWYPDGQVEVVADCLYPDGRQTGNTAIPFTLTIGSAQATETTEETTEPSGATPSESESSASETAGTSELSDPASDSSLTARLQPPPPVRLGFVIDKAPGGGGENRLFLSGKLTGFTGEVTVELVTRSSRQTLDRLSVNEEEVWTEVIFPDSLNPGTYTVQATQSGVCSPGGQACEVTEYSPVVVSGDSIRILGVDLPRSQLDSGGVTTWPIMVALLMVAGGIGLVAWSGVRKRVRG